MKDIVLSVQKNCLKLESELDKLVLYLKDLSLAPRIYRMPQKMFIIITVGWSHIVLKLKFSTKDI